MVGPLGDSYVPRARWGQERNQQVQCQVQNQATQVSPSPGSLPFPSLRLSLSEVVLRNRIHIGSKNTGWSLH